MSNATRTVSATCACGAVFTREAKRGRPQVWCPACIIVPFYDRVRVQVANTTSEAGVVSETKPVNENDPLSNVREQLNAEVIEADARYSARYAAFVAAGVDKHLAVEQANYKITFDEIVAIYAKYRGV